MAHQRLSSRFLRQELAYSQGAGSVGGKGRSDRFSIHVVDCHTGGANQEGKGLVQVSTGKAGAVQEA